MKKIAALLLALLLLCGCVPMVPASSTSTAGSSTAAPGTAASTTTAPPKDSMTVHFIDVGQADAILIECNGLYMLIDGGNKADSSLMVSYLQKQGVEELEMVVNTHPHEDHCGGLAGVLAVYPTKLFLTPTTTYSSKAFENMMKYVDQQRLEPILPKPGDTFTLGAASVTVLGPGKSYSDVNNYSIVLLVQLGEKKFLFTGDMERDAEQDILDAGISVKADVLKVGHHGSATSTSYRFLYEVDPDYAVICVGKDNSYGHPHEEPMSRLRDAEVPVYRTDLMGTILAHTDGESIQFSWEKTSVAAPTAYTSPRIQKIADSLWSMAA